MYQEPNNEFGTHDHEYDSGRFGVKNNLMVRVETCIKDKLQASVTYYLNDGKWEKGQGHCAGQIRGDFHGHRCGNKGKLEYRGRQFCKIHHPPTAWAKKFKREKAWRAKFDADWARGEWRDEVRKWKEECYQALIKISEGELNDPAGYAQMVLEDRPKEPTDD